jgi:hypothetical protein
MDMEDALKQAREALQEAYQAALDEPLSHPDHQADLVLSLDVMLTEVDFALALAGVEQNE